MDQNVSLDKNGNSSDINTAKTGPGSKMTEVVPLMKY